MHKSKIKLLWKNCKIEKKSAKNVFVKNIFILRLLKKVKLNKTLFLF